MVDDDQSRFPESESLEALSATSFQAPGNPVDQQHQDDFFDLLVRSQEQRMDDQRCSLMDANNNSNNNTNNGNNYDNNNNQENQQETNDEQQQREQGSLQRSNSHPSSSLSLSSPRPMNSLSTSNSASAYPDQSRPATASGQNGGNSSSPSFPVNLFHNSARRSSNPVISGGRYSNNSLSTGLQSSSTYGSSASDIGANQHEFLDMIAALQSRRLDEQRASLSVLRKGLTTNRPENPQNVLNTNRSPVLPPIQSEDFEFDRPVIPRQSRQMSLGANILPDDDFFERLMKCQSSRLEDQRVTLPHLFSPSNVTPTATAVTPTRTIEPSSGSANPLPTARASFARGRSATVCDSQEPISTSEASQKTSDDDFFGVLMRFQSARIEDQRSALPKDKPHTSPSNSSIVSSSSNECKKSTHI